MLLLLVLLLLLFVKINYLADNVLVEDTVKGLPCTNIYYFLHFIQRSVKGEYRFFIYFLYKLKDN